MMSVLSAGVSEDRNARVLLLASLALNLFFVGAAGTLLTRHYLSPPAASVPIDRSVAGRIDRLAATLPASDADILRAEVRADSARVEAAQSNYRQAQERVREALRAEPFDPARLSAAMAETRNARPAFDQALQELIASAAAKISKAGREKIADWPPRQRTPNETNR
jgi:uncharacterized membrane protein